MSESAEQLLDPWELSRSEEPHTQTISFTEMPYVLEAQLGDSGSAKVVIEIMHQTDGKLVLRMNIETSLVLECQRCLGHLNEQLKIQSERLLIKSEDDLKQVNDDESDVLICESTLDVSLLVQEEILLAMPMIAKHDTCEFNYENAAESKNETHQPFADLKNLLN